MTPTRPSELRAPVPAPAMENVRSLLRQAGIALALLAGLAVSGAIAQSPVVDLRNLAPGDLRTDGFVLERRGHVQIEAVGSGPSSSTDSWFTRTFGSFDKSKRDEHASWQGNAWILDARTRAIVWELRDADTEKGRKDLRTFEGSLRLPAGVYEVYYAAFPAGWQARSNGWFDNDRGKASELTRDFHIAISGDGVEHADRGDRERAREEFDRTSVVSLRRVTASSSQRMGFTLNRPTDIEIYAIGEARSDGVFDYGWIINTESRQRVWQLRYAFSEPAGGADKNRIVRRTLSLPAGRYAAFYASDDSHDPSEWNDAPPHDPDYYGLTIRAANAGDRASIQTFAYDPWPSGKAVVSLIQMHDHDNRSAGFTLSRAANVRVYAIGEASGDRMVDRGWIIDDATREKVWSMEKDATEAAGGAEKNRMIDEVVRLEPGSYRVYYATDDSHSYGDWNAAPPLDQEHWGISIFPATDRDESAFGPYEERATRGGGDAKFGGPIAEILHVGDDAHERVPFTLDRDTELRVHAIGEGSGGQMYDYAWIQDAQSREIVWEMRYRGTKHAGGADKNREVSETLRLPAGSYVLHYRSDGSHSFENWNADAPDDPEHWGVVLSRVIR